MRLSYLITTLLLYPLYSFSSPSSNEAIFFDAGTPSDKNTLFKSFTSGDERASLRKNMSTRTVDYPTQVIRMTHSIEQLQLTCEEVNKQIDDSVINKITKDKFFYATAVTCTYDPETRIATQFSLNSYFDPLDDEAITYLNTYLEEFNGSSLLGTQLTIESAKAVIVSLNITVGTKKNPVVPPFIVFRSDRSNYYFKNNFELKNSLLSDINERFFTDDPSKIMPFLDKWIFNHAGKIYKNILRDSNYVLLEPERIFIMESGEPVFISLMKNYYTHNCTVYDHHHCLRQEL
jgi:hypothetical protein